MDYETTLAGGHDSTEKMPFSSLKVHRGMDSFENFLGDLDGMKSSGEINYVLTSAQRIVGAESDSDGVDSDEESLYEALKDSCPRKKPNNSIQSMHHSGDLEKMFRKPGATSGGEEEVEAPVKAGRRPKASSRSPRVSSQKHASAPQRPSSMNDITRATDGSPNVERSRKSVAKTRESRDSLSRTQHSEVSSSAKLKDELSKSEHRAPRIRRNDLYASRHRASGGDRVKSKSLSDPNAIDAARSAVRRQRSMRSTTSTDNPVSAVERSRSARNLRSARQPQQQQSRGSLTEDALHSAVEQRRRRRSRTSDQEENKGRSSSVRRSRRPGSTSAPTEAQRRSRSSSQKRRPGHSSSHKSDDIPSPPNSERPRRRGSLGAKSNHENSPPSSHRLRGKGSLSAKSDHEASKPNSYRVRRRGSIGTKSDHKESPQTLQRPKELSRRERCKSSTQQSDAPSSARNISIVGGEIHNVMQSPTAKANKHENRDEDDQSPAKAKVDHLIHNLRRESKRNVMAAMKGGTRNLMVEM